MPLSNLKQILSDKGSAITVSEEPGVPDDCSEEDRYRMIAEAAYFRALGRGFEGGHEQEDWYAAEAEIEQAVGR
jgi:hypothetical protein